MPRPHMSARTRLCVDVSVLAGVWPQRPLPGPVYLVPWWFILCSHSIMYGIIYVAIPNSIICIHSIILVMGLTRWG